MTESTPPGPEDQSTPPETLESPASSAAFVARWHALVAHLGALDIRVTGFSDDRALAGSVVAQMTLAMAALVAAQEGLSLRLRSVNCSAGNAECVLAAAEDLYTRATMLITKYQ